MGDKAEAAKGGEARSRAENRKDEGGREMKVAV